MTDPNKEKSGRILTDFDVLTGDELEPREFPPIKYESECYPKVMTPEQSAAFEEYWRNRPTDIAERDRLRRVWQGLS